MIADASPLTVLLLFARLSLLAFGGGNSVVPEMQREVVDLHHWMSAADFAALFALAQAAPGPNMMVTSLIGFRVAGLAGAIAATLGIIGPSSVLTIAAVGVWARFRDATWRQVVQAALVPVTIGLIATSAAVITLSADTGWLLAAITLVVTVLLLRTRWHPLWFLAGGAAVGMAFAH